MGFHLVLLFPLPVSFRQCPTYIYLSIADLVNAVKLHTPGTYREPDESTLYSMPGFRKLDIIVVSTSRFPK